MPNVPVAQGNGKRPRRGRFAKAGNLEAARERAVRALRLRLGGHSFEAIGKALGCGTMTAYRDIEGAMQAAREQMGATVAELREVETLRLDALLSFVWSKAASGDADAARVALKIGERRAKLWGLDAPISVAAVLDARSPMETALAERLATMTTPQLAERLRMLAAQVEAKALPAAPVAPETALAPLADPFRDYREELKRRRAQ